MSYIPPRQIANTPDAFRQALQRGLHVTVEGLVGRLIRGTKPEHFETLTDVPNERRIIQLTDSQGLTELLAKKDTRAMLNHVGWADSFINDKVASGHQFKLVVFPEHGTPARRAYWLEQLEVVAAAWPELAGVITHTTALSLLRKWPFEYWDGQVRSLPGACGISQLDAGHPLRDLSTGLSALKLRIFLYYAAQLKELFSGDGFTWNADGTRGLPEYTMANQAIKNIPGAMIIDLPPV